MSRWLVGRSQWEVVILIRIRTGLTRVRSIRILFALI